VLTVSRSVPSPAPARALLRLDVTSRAERVDPIAAALWARGAIGVWEQADAVTAWFTDGRAREALAGGVDGVAELEPANQRWSTEPDRDWQAEWKATIGPVRAGRITIQPSWLIADHRPEPDEIVLELDPGRAFGTGHHATTTLCLEVLDDLAADGRLADRRLADIGCGTGVLAIAAARLGATVVGVDIDPDAVEVSRINAARNHVEATFSTGSIGAITSPVPVVVANLVTDVVLALAEPLVAATTQTLVVSGVASERQQRVRAALEAAGARIDEVRERDGWVAIVASPTGVQQTGADGAPA
jgi:ribosomal protein L11 methyltransferase